MKQTYLFFKFGIFFSLLWTATYAQDQRIPEADEAYRKAQTSVKELEAKIKNINEGLVSEDQRPEIHAELFSPEDCHTIECLQNEYDRLQEEMIYIPKSSAQWSNKYFQSQSVLKRLDEYAKRERAAAELAKKTFEFIHRAADRVQKISDRILNVCPNDSE